MPGLQEQYLAWLNSRAGQTQGPQRRRNLAPNRRLGAAGQRPQVLSTPSSPQERQKGQRERHGDRQDPRPVTLLGKKAAMNDALRISGYLLWGLVGLALAMASKVCFVDPVLPSLCLGLLVAYLC